MVVLSDIRSTIYMAISIIPNTETLPMVLEGLEKLYQKSGSCACREDPKVHQTGLTFLITILVSSE